MVNFTKGNVSESGNEYPKIWDLNHEKSLITDLLSNYKVKYGRPVKNMTEKVVVYFEVSLVQLIDLVNSL